MSAALFSTLCPSHWKAAMDRAKHEPNTIRRDLLVAYTIERLRNRGGHWEGDPNARKVLIEMLEIAERQKAESK